MELKKFRAQIYLNESRGSATTWVYTMSTDPFSAMAQFSAMYGKMLVSKFALAC